MWFVGDCPQQFNDCSPEGYGPGTVALCLGPTMDGEPPLGWFDAIQARAGLSDAAASTMVLRYVDVYQWTVYYDPAGIVARASPLVTPWPLQ